MRSIQRGQLTSMMVGAHPEQARSVLNQSPGAEFLNAAMLLFSVVTARYPEIEFTYKLDWYLI